MTTGELLQLIATFVTLSGIVVTGIVGIRVARQNREARKDQTPADANEATKIANDLIFRLLDKAKDEVTRTEGLLERMTAEAEKYKDLADLVPGLRTDLTRAIRERDRLSKAIHYLEAKVRVVGSISYAEVVEWAQLALTPDADPELFEVDITEVLPDGLEDTVTTL